MDYAKQAQELKDVLGLSGEPVAITFTNEEVEDPGNKRMWVCQALKQAARGKSYVIDAERSACGGGTMRCGFSGLMSGEPKRKLQWFLTRGEKLTANIVTFERMQTLGAAAPTGLADRVVMTPLTKAKIRPDLVVFLCNAEQACRLVALDTYWDGLKPPQEITGSLCHMVISYPLMTGNTNLSLGDWTARHMQKFAPDVVFLTVPYERMHNLIEAIPECTAGTAEAVIPPEFRLTTEE
jgi:uncharacterized protein (DUF169 family)